MHALLVAAGLLPLALARGELAADLTLEIFAAPNQLAKPASFAHDLWWGVTQRWTVGVIHSSRSIDRIDAGAGTCLRRGIEDCSERWSNIGADARYLVRDDLALRARFLVRDVAPWKPAITIGALYRRGFVTTDPYLRLGIANTDEGNRAALVVPVWLAVTPGPVTLALHTGVDGELVNWRDGWHVPVGAVVALAVTSQLAAVVEAGFSSLLGPQNDEKHRSVMVTLAWRSQP